MLLSPSTIVTQDGPGGDEPGLNAARTSFNQRSWDDRQQAPNIDAVDLGPPISTLRSLGAMHGYPRAHELDSDVATTARSRESTAQYGPFDPISNGILTMNEASRAIDVFFQHCHPMAPVLSESLRSQAASLRTGRSMLFLTLCSIGTRFWRPTDMAAHKWPTWHPKCSELAVLLDKAVSQLLLRPTPNDVHADSVVVLLLYAQWMPYGKQAFQDTNDASRKRSVKRSLSRYNDISAWAVLGLAARYAAILDLGRGAIAPFRRQQLAITHEDMSKLRIWFNLLTCDWNLMLSSSLPSTLDPTEGATIARTFGTHPIAQQPNDLRYAALVELVSISHSVLETNKEFSARRLNAAGLRKFNMACDDWESTDSFSGSTYFQHVHLPFTSLRWCRLALNSAVLGPYLNSNPDENIQPSHLWVLEAVETSISAATQIIFCVSTLGHEHIWSLDAQNASTVPREPFVVDKVTLERLSYAVDSTWVSYTFAVTFLAFCYVKGVVNDELRLRCLTGANSPQNVAPRSPRPGSLLARLLRLALDLFDAMCEGPIFPLAQELQGVVKDCVILLLADDGGNRNNEVQVDTTGMQSLFDQMMDPGFDWPVFTEDWDIGGTPLI
ncbi:hypothetical protein PV08_06335 [Exophiala spinifera]|uniref:Transcription factor domain-containing protein n=1 Tax=Exophiala spinifera TaxID=91928 RepID=A0A0D2BY91_9EURO|nr:uncharacterized protein PV08_06335 [Exophiala spinifera]KIW16284.1 hypothetical protein PV08_06335 [Exophiala spinifera]